MEPKNFHSQESFEQLIAALQSNQITPACKAAESLGKLGDLRAVPALIETLKDKHENSFVRTAAAKALGQLGDQSAIEPLIEALKYEYADGGAVSLPIVRYASKPSMLWAS